MDMRFLGWFVVCALAFGQAPTVTDTKWVDAGKSKELLRKINGRWWSQDNREVSPPAKGGFFWVLDSKPGVCEFFHHRPFRMDRAESLHLWMTKDEVEAALGPPNRVFGTDGHGFWYYYASDGIKLEVRFMDGVLGEAKYNAAGEKSWSVASIEREMNGRDIYKLMQERALERSKERAAATRAENLAESAARNEALRQGHRPGSSRLRGAQPNVVTVGSVPVPHADPQPAPKRIVPAATLAAIAVGATRDDVLTQLGEPNARFAITGDEGTRESFTYDLDSGEAVVIRLLDGKVVKVR
jgi:outer membrane protein assembly factor BamE (lipoprotein component of BamABCDE complex)